MTTFHGNFLFHLKIFCKKSIKIYFTNDTDFKAVTNIKAGTTDLLKSLINGATCNTFYQRRFKDQIFPVEMSLMNTAEGGNLMTTAEGGNRWNAETHLPNVLLTSTANCRNWILF